MLSDAATPEAALLELAIYTAVRSARISDGDASRLLGSDDRFFINEMMNRREKEIASVDRLLEEQDAMVLSSFQTLPIRSAA